MIPKGLEAEVAYLNKAGMKVDIVEVDGQCYVVVRGLAATCPPWGKNACDILIAVPVTYEQAGLDGFYLALPYSFKDGEHPRVNGQVVDVSGCKWRQVSWHYADGHPWKPGVDNLEGHIKHCHGFFSGRGATNAYN